jgi:hypothetical protein
MRRALIIIESVSRFIEEKKGSEVAREEEAWSWMAATGQLVFRWTRQFVGR